MISWIYQIDTTIADFFQYTNFPPFLDAIMAGVTRLGDHGVIWIVVTAALLVFPRTRKIGLAAGIALILCFLAVDGIIRPLVARPRPYVDMPNYVILVEKLSMASFPSGHAASSFATAMVYFHYKPERTWVFVVLAALIAFSRVYLNMHYVTDVMAGVLVGWLISLAGIALAEKLYPKLPAALRSKTQH